RCGAAGARPVGLPAIRVESGVQGAVRPAGSPCRRHLISRRPRVPPLPPLRIRPPDSSARRVLDLHEALVAANVLHDLGDPERLSRLRDDVRRIARDMEDPGRPPPMYWTGVPWPRGEEREDCDWCLTISIGGTNTHWHLSRLRGGEVHVLSPEGREVTGDELSRVRESSSMRTPTAADTASGIEMVRRIVEHVSRSLRPHRHLLPSVRH